MEKTYKERIEYYRKRYQDKKDDILNYQKKMYKENPEKPIIKALNVNIKK
jgi:hypothetical protein